MYRLLRRRPHFRRLFLAQAASRAGDAFNTVALVVVVFQLTGSGTGVAAAVALEVIPVLAFGPIAGLLADRLPRRQIMIAADLGRAALAALLVVEHNSTAVVYVAAFGLATGSVFFGPAATSVVPEAVDADELVDANAALWTVAVLAQVLLAPAAGFVIAALGVGPAFSINAASFLVSAALLWRLPIGTKPAAAGTRAGWAELAAGAHTVRAHPLLKRLVVVQGLAALSAGATSGLLVVLANHSLGVGPTGFGLLLAAIGTGAALGPILLRRWIRPASRAWLFGPYAVRGGVDLTLAAVANPYAAGSALLVYGMSTSTGMIAYNTTLQTEIAPAVRGRTYAFYDIIWNAARLVSLGLGGLLADAIGVRSVYLAGGLLLLIAALYGARRPLHVQQP